MEKNFSYIIDILTEGDLYELFEYLMSFFIFLSPFISVYFFIRFLKNKNLKYLKWAYYSSLFFMVFTVLMMVTTIILFAGN